MIYTLSSNSSFCDSLASLWLDEQKSDLWGLSQITIYVPTNRAAKTLREAFLRQSKGKTLLLPKIISFANLDVFDATIPQAISFIERQLILSKLIQKKQPMGEDKAFALAQSLAELIDEMHQYDVHFEDLKSIAPENFAEHWQETLSFLDIMDSYWPEILAEKGKTDPSLYQIKQADSLIQKWQTNKPNDLIYAVGFTGGLPIVERFLKAVSLLPNGRIYIPDLDTDMPDDIWENVDETHPSYYQKRLLDYLNVKRKDVIRLDENISDRFHLLSVALTPAAETQIWQENLHLHVDENIRLIECQTPQNEAFEIACLLREVLQTPEKTAALVTPDRQLARRVKIQMQKWNVILDDSAGTPLNLTPVGTFLIQLAQAAVSQKQSDLLCVLKHPLCLDGQDYATFRKTVHQAEKQARQTHKNMDLTLNTDLSPFMNLFVNPVRIPFAIILQEHLHVAQALCASADRTGAERLWAGDSGQTASELLTQVMANADVIGDVEPMVYADFLNMILQTTTVRQKYGMHPRLDILGPIEARLQQPDLVIVGGLNEGTFPQTPKSDSWINRPMRQMCGLPLPEEKIGVAAQDFMHLLQAKQVILTRSLKQDGVQTIPSRWLSRLQTVCEKSKQNLKTYQESYSCYAACVERKPPATRPNPKPDVKLRPKKLSISDICTFLKDPYAIYAKHILKLYKLDDFQDDPNEAAFGNVVHNALAAFLRLPSAEQTHDKLLQLGDNFCLQEGINYENNAFFKPRFQKIATWFMTEYRNSFPKAIRYLIEQSAVMEMNINHQKFYLTGRADRIDIFADNTANIIDYKTGGKIPSKSSVKNYEEPQLPLEALMLEKGCFTEKKIEPKDLSYWHIKGRAEGGEIKVVTPVDMGALLDDIQNKVYDLLETYDDNDTGYPACPKVKYQPAFNDYAHLERLAEWQNEEDE